MVQSSTATNTNSLAASNTNAANTDADTARAGGDNYSTKSSDVFWKRLLKEPSQESQQQQQQQQQQQKQHKMPDTVKKVPSYDGSEHKEEDYTQENIIATQTTASAGFRSSSNSSRMPAEEDEQRSQALLEAHAEFHAKLMIQQQQQNQQAQQIELEGEAAGAAVKEEHDDVHEEKAGEEEISASPQQSNSPADFVDEESPKCNTKAVEESDIVLTSHEKADDDDAVNESSETHPTNTSTDTDTDNSEHFLSTPDFEAAEDILKQRNYLPDKDNKDIGANSPASSYTDKQQRNQAETQQELSPLTDHASVNSSSSYVNNDDGEVEVDDDDDVVVDQLPSKEEEDDQTALKEQEETAKDGVTLNANATTNISSTVSSTMNSTINNATFAESSVVAESTIQTLSKKKEDEEDEVPMDEPLRTNTDNNKMKPSPEVMTQMFAKAFHDAARKELETRLQQQQQRPQKQKQVEEELPFDVILEEKKTDSPLQQQERCQDYDQQRYHSHSLPRQQSPPAAAAAAAAAHGPSFYNLQSRPYQKFDVSSNAIRSHTSSSTSSPKMNQVLVMADSMDQQINNVTASTTSNTSSTSTNRATTTNNKYNKKYDEANTVHAAAIQMAAQAQKANSAASSAPSASAQKHSAVSKKVHDHHNDASANSSQDWLFKAKRQAETKALALIEKAQKEAAARSRAREVLLARRQHQERERLKAQAEAKLKAKAAQDALNFKEMKAQWEAEEQAKIREKALAKAEAEAKLRAKAQVDAAQARAFQEARTRAKEDAELKLRQKADRDERFMAELRAAGQVLEEQERKSKEAAAKVQARVQEDDEKDANIFSQTLSAAQLKAKNVVAKGNGRASAPAAAATAVSSSSSSNDDVPAPKDFVPFGKSKGEDDISYVKLYLQVPGVVHVSELKVELEDGVIYISRGIVVPNKGLQKFTRSFPFEEELLDTSGISVTLIPANATADKVSVLRFSLPKIRTTPPFQISINMGLAQSITIHNDASTNDTEVSLQDISLTAPEDEISEHKDRRELESMNSFELPDDERAAASSRRKASEGDNVTRNSSSSNDSNNMYSIWEENGERIYSIHVPASLTLEDVSARYDGTSICVQAAGDANGVMDHVFPVMVKEVNVRHTTGTLDVAGQRLILRVPLTEHRKQNWLKQQPLQEKKGRRLKVHKLEDKESTFDLISLFDDDTSLLGKSTSGSKKKSTNLHVPKGITKLASKYIKHSSKILRGGSSKKK